MKLFMLHYAGGNSNFYHSWVSKFDDQIEVYLIDLPGHGRRMKEKLLEDYEEVCSLVFNEIVKTLEEDDEYSVFGHSMGGLITYTLIIWLVKHGYKNVHNIFISGCESPNIERFRIKTIDLSEEQLIERIVRIGGTNQLALKSKEFHEIFLPIIKADFIVLDSFCNENPGQQLGCDITLLNGQEDYRVMNGRLQWEGFTSGAIRYYTFEGGHFYLSNDSVRDEICLLINRLLLDDKV